MTSNFSSKNLISPEETTLQLQFLLGLDLNSSFFNTFFQTLLNDFVCPYCCKEGTYQVSPLNELNLSFNCAKYSDSCHNSLTSVYFFSLCHKQGIVLKNEKATAKNTSLNKISNIEKIENNIRTFDIHDQAASDSCKGESFIETNDFSLQSTSRNAESFKKTRDTGIISNEDDRLIRSNERLLDQLYKSFDLNQRLLQGMQVLESRIGNNNQSNQNVLPPYEPNNSGDSLILSTDSISSEASFEQNSPIDHLPGGEVFSNGEVSESFPSSRNDSLSSTKKSSKKKVKKNNPKIENVESDSEVFQEYESNIPSNSNQIMNKVPTQAQKIEKNHFNCIKQSNEVVLDSLKKLPSELISPSRLERALHACRKIEFKIPERIKKDSRFKKKNRDFVAIEIMGVKRQSFSTVKSHFRELGIEPETTPSLYFLGPELLDVIISSSLVDFFLNRLMSSELPRPDKKIWYPTTIQNISL